MTKTRDNSLTMNYSGKYGNQFVYRVRDDVSILAKKPRKTKKPTTEAQSEVREYFTEAARWAKKALQNPELLALYSSQAKGMKTAFVIAVTNFMHPPVVREINVSEYTGAKTDRIRVKAFDNLYIKGVSLKITDASGTLIEQGSCELDSLGSHWNYTATSEVPSITGLVITAVAIDHPEHTGSLSRTL